MKSKGLVFKSSRIFVKEAKSPLETASEIFTANKASKREQASFYIHNFSVLASLPDGCKLEASKVSADEQYSIGLSSNIFVILLVTEVTLKLSQESFGLISRLASSSALASDSTGIGGISGAGGV